MSGVLIGLVVDRASEAHIGLPGQLKSFLGGLGICYDARSKVAPSSTMYLGYTCHAQCEVGVGEVTNCACRTPSYIYDTILEGVACVIGSKRRSLLASKWRGDIDHYVEPHLGHDIANEI